jgi:excisionase family DNA binding protein
MSDRGNSLLQQKKYPIRSPELREKLPLGEATIRRLITRGELGHVRIASRIFISESDLEAYFTRNHVEPVKIEA